MTETTTSIKLTYKQAKLLDTLLERRDIELVKYGKRLAERKNYTGLREAKQRNEEERDLVREVSRLLQGAK